MSSLKTSATANRVKNLEAEIAKLQAHAAFEPPVAPRGLR